MLEPRFDRGFFIIMINAVATAPTRNTEQLHVGSTPAASALFDFLSAVFTALDQAAINYALLRGYEELQDAQNHIEVDLLVAPEDLPRLAGVVARESFVALPNWGHAPHHFFLGFDRHSGGWLKLDVVTELRYGAPARVLRVDLAETCLQGRERRAPTYVLAPEHEFFTLLLHCLLDKKKFREERRARLQNLFEALHQSNEARARCEALLAKVLTPALPWGDLQNIFANGDWHALLKRHNTVAARLHKGQRFAVWTRSIHGKLLRRLRPLFFAMRQRGLFIALLAPDGAGKSTLAQALKKDFGVKAQLIYMGTNIAALNVSLPTTKWLHRLLKKSRAPKALKLALKPVNYLNRICDLWYRIAYAHVQRLRGKFVVFDRYVYDSWIAKPANTWAKRMRRKFLEAGWPAPHLVILLDAPGELLFRRKGEHSPEWLEQQRQAYLALQKHVPQMRAINAMQAAEEVRREVIALVWEKYKKKNH